MPDKTPLELYRHLEQQLAEIRQRIHGPSAAEEAITEKMTNAWHQLTKEEQDLLDREGPQCWPRCDLGPSTRFHLDTDSQDYQRFKLCYESRRFCPGFSGFFLCCCFSGKRRVPC